MSRRLLDQTLDDLAPEQGKLPLWEEILERAGIESPALTRRPLW